MPRRRQLLLRHEKRLRKAGYSSIAGVDEAGRGPLAGPVVAGAVILRSFDFKETIDDSKLLSAKKRQRAFDEIMQKAIVGIGIVDEKIIDEINIYRATIRAMEVALSGLQTKPDYLLVDGTMHPYALCASESIVRGDSTSLSIAAASIVAKVTRDGIMKEYDAKYPVYGFMRHKGYATLAHRLAIKEYGPSPIHRRSFSVKFPID